MCFGGSKSTTTNNFSPEQQQLQKGFANWAMPDGENFREAAQFSDQDIQNRGQQGTAPLNNYHRAAQDTAWEAAKFWDTNARDAKVPLYNSGTNYNQAANSNTYSGVMGRQMYGGVANSDMYGGVAQAPGWSTNTLQHYAAPGNEMVLNPALQGLHSAYIKGNTGILGDAASRGALNNDRTGVAQSNLAAGYADQVAKTIGDHYFGVYDRANSAMQGDFSRRLGAQGFNRDSVYGNNSQRLQDMGFNRDTVGQNNNTILQDADFNRNSVYGNNTQRLQDLSFNRGTVDQNNRTNANLSNNLMSYMGNYQKLGGNAANIQAGIGDMDRNYQQQVLDTGRQGLQADSDYPLKIAQATQGYMLTPQSTTSKQGGGAGSFLGPLASVGGAIISSDPKAKTKIKKEKPDDILKRFSGGSYSFDYTKDAQAKAGQPSGRQVGIMFDDKYHKAGGTTQDVGGYRGKDVREQINELNAAVAALVEKSSKVRSK